VNRATRLLDDLINTLDAAGDLVSRGRDAYDDDPALPLAFEALSNRIGDLCKQLVALDPERFSHHIWCLAARNRDFVVHHYSRIDRGALWSTAIRDFPALRGFAQQVRS
jgi:uncharacterized protein with HEPN domain